MNKKFRALALSLAAACACVSLASCGGSDPNKTAQQSGEGNKITYWVGMNGNTSQTASNLGDTAFGKELMKRTGVTIEYQHPALGQEAEKFNVMIASGSLPDIIEYDWLSKYPGGAEKALADGIIQEIDIEKEAPNFAAYLKEHPELEKDVKTDSGKYFGFPFIRGDELLLTSAGPILRKDWLDDLGLEVPETIDEWTTVLKAFKDKKGATAPLALSTGGIGWGTFIGAYDTFDGLYVRDGKIAYGPMDDSYKDFLVQMNKWYKEGLLDPNYASLDGNMIQSNMLNGISGAAYGSCGSGIGKWMAAATDDKYDLVGAKYPVLHKGDTPQFGSYETPVTGSDWAVITRDCKNKELCLKLLDYAYSDEGHMLFNFGIEGESYEMEGDYPKYTELITKNPDGLSMAVALGQYTLSHYIGPFVQDKRYMEQYAQLPQQQEALQNWMDINMKEHVVPKLSLTTDQQNEISTLLENINTYKSEMQAKFIMGTEPIEKFDEFREQLKTRGVEKYLEYEQQAYDRYLKR